MADDVTPEGAVKAVRLPDPSCGEGELQLDGGIPTLDSPVVVEVNGHPHRYVVRVAPSPDGPVLVELRMISDTGAPIDYAAIKSVQVRRLAYAAMQWLTSARGLFAQPGDTSEALAKSERAEGIRRQRKADGALLADVAAHATYAVEHGLRVQDYVGQRMNASTSTVARWLRKAKAEGFMPDVPLPKRRKGGRTHGVALTIVVQSHTVTREFGE
ncbi:hypothetical protein ACFXO9_26585 [Nocardia tengchongensis]|uniref:hypothetical protein n=1 Tax=Nocardia tengchongensis TaxID=2055889 RepID=UPI0036A3CDB6